LLGLIGFVRVAVDAFVELAFSFFHCLLALEVIELLKRLLRKVDFGLLITLYFLEYLFVFILSVEEEGSHDLFEQIHVEYLETFSCCIPYGVFEELFECLFLILVYFCGKQVSLSHICFSNV
jgi:hypothetical protein